MRDRLRQRESFVWPVRVYREDTDAGGMFVVSEVQIRYHQPAPPTILELMR